MKTTEVELDFDEDAEYPHGQCTGCGNPLTRKERQYLTYTCTRCELDDAERLEAWRQGAEDPELDTLFARRGRLN